MLCDTRVKSGTYTGVFPFGFFFACSAVRSLPNAKPAARSFSFVEHGEPFRLRPSPGLHTFAAQNFESGAELLPSSFPQASFGGFPSRRSEPRCQLRRDFPEPHRPRRHGPTPCTGCDNTGFTGPLLPAPRSSCHSGHAHLLSKSWHDASGTNCVFPDALAQFSLHLLTYFARRPV